VDFCIEKSIYESISYSQNRCTQWYEINTYAGRRYSNGFNTVFKIGFRFLFHTGNKPADSILMGK
jgi:hypothetical protein